MLFFIVILAASPTGDTKYDRKQPVDYDKIIRMATIIINKPN